MAKYPQIGMAIEIGSTNKERLEAYELYRQAFNAKLIYEISEDTPVNDDDIHVCMKIYGVDVMLCPKTQNGDSMNNMVYFETHYDDENEFRKTYDILIREAKKHPPENPWPTHFARLFTAVTDKYGISWGLFLDKAE